MNVRARTQALAPFDQEMDIETPPPVGVFVYGSLLERSVLNRVIGRAFAGESLSARLKGWQRVADRWDYPFLVESPRGAVVGMLLLDLTPDDLARLDAYEDVGSGLYERIQVAVQTWSCGPVPLPLPAWTYVAGPKLRQMLGL